METLDKCFENVCELDLIFHMDKVGCGLCVLLWPAPLSPALCPPQPVLLELRSFSEGRLVCSGSLFVERMESWVGKLSAWGLLKLLSPVPRRCDAGLCDVPSWGLWLWHPLLTLLLRGAALSHGIAIGWAGGCHQCWVTVQLSDRDPCWGSPAGVVELGGLPCCARCLPLCPGTSWESWGRFTRAAGKKRNNGSVWNTNCLVNCSLSHSL